MSSRVLLFPSRISTLCLLPSNPDNWQSVDNRIWLIYTLCAFQISSHRGVWRPHPPKKCNRAGYTKHKKQKCNNKISKSNKSFSLFTNAKATIKKNHCSCSKHSVVYWNHSCPIALLAVFRAAFRRSLVIVSLNPNTGDQSPFWSQDPSGLLHLCLLHQPHRHDVPYRRRNCSPQQVLLPIMNCGSSLWWVVVVKLVTNSCKAIWENLKGPARKFPNWLPTDITGAH